MKAYRHLLTLMLMCSIQVSMAWTQDDPYIIEHIGVRDGLSKNEVISIIRDHEGFLWFGTRGGLSRYDGYEFDKFQPEPGLETTLQNPSIERIYEDSRGYLWIGTKSGGLSRMNLKTRSIEYFDYSEDSTGLNDIRVISFFEDSSGRMWIGTYNGGINKFNYQSGTFEYYLSDQNVRDFCQTRDGTLWAIQNGSVMKYDEVNDEFEPAGMSGDFRIRWPACMVEDPDRPFLWIGGWGTGLYRYNYQTGGVKVFYAEDSYAMTLKNIYSLSFDKQGTLWIGTWGMGLWNYNPKKESLSRLNINTEFQNSEIEENAILDIYADSNANIWVGTNRCGIVKISRKEPFTNLDIYNQAGSIQEHEQITYIFNDDRGNLFVGTINELFWSRDGKTFHKVQGLKDVETVDANNVIHSIYQLENGKIWVGSSKPLAELHWRNGIPYLRLCSEVYNNEALDLLKPKSFLETNNALYIGTQQLSLYKFSKTNESFELERHFEVHPSQEGAIPNSRVDALLKDSRGRKWIGTYRGLGLLEDDSFIPIKNKLVNKAGLLCKIVNTIYEDSGGNIWVATPCGLNKLSATGDGNFRLTYYTAKDGLPENYVNAIMEDDQGYLWLSTNISIIKFDPKQERFISFYQGDGFDVYNFIESSSLKDKKGNLYFGGIGGLTRFHPDSIQPNYKVPKIAFTSMSIWNKPIYPNQKFNDRIILDRSINQIEKIKLTYRQDEFSLKIAAMDFNNPKKNHYAYKLEGHNEDWIQMSNRRIISFNNLPHGEYILHVKGSNNNNIWNEQERILRIEITPPWWKTNYALGLYSLIVIGIVLLIRWIAIRQTSLAHQVEMLKLNNEHERQIDEMKLKFFTNISHEFRTPLTLIVGPLDEILGKLDFYALNEEVGHKLKLVRKNALRLKKLVNQLIDFRKAESGNLKLQVTQTNILEFVEEVSISFKELARINHIHFTIQPEITNKMVYIDRDKMEIVINNLVSNSIKHVGEGGSIDVKLTEDEQYVNIHIIDNGPGIPQQELDCIFERFYQIETTQNYGSSGIGLALTKRLVDLHKGQININSEVNKKTEFIVNLLKGKAHFTEKELVKRKNLKKEQNMEYVELPVLTFYKRKSSRRKTDKTILLVEDDREVMDYIAGLLEPLYHIITAGNGKEAMDLAFEKKPDLIISDIMMPEMDGFEFCSKLKNNHQLFNIPVILLTAKSASKFEIYGVRAGADDYISKPFDPELLKEKIYSLLQHHDALRERYTQKVKIEGSHVEVTHYEQELIRKAIQIIEDNMVNPELNPNFLSQKLNLSHSTLYRKIKRATDLSIIGFINKIKLQRAAQLLTDKDKTITEVTYEVGFNSTKHFRNSFFKEYNQTPGEYQKKEGVSDEQKLSQGG